jgi:hypothetical protein
MPCVSGDPFSKNAIWSWDSIHLQTSLALNCRPFPDQVRQETFSANEIDICCMARTKYFLDVCKQPVQCTQARLRFQTREWVGSREMAPCSESDRDLLHESKTMLGALTS